MTAAHAKHDMAKDGMAKGPYLRLAAMVGLSFVAMYVLMYAMVDVLGNALPNLNQAYMAGLMTAPMLMLELLLMGHMYANKKLNAGLIVGGVLLLGLCWLGIREQAAIGDEQFLKSMIPHHAGAILMCKEAPLRDPKVKQLCAGIIESQQAEIAQMKARLAALDSEQVK
jgi:uncharacterized protein (DUF305 family)